VKIVVDTNIVFSAILNTQSRIGQILVNGSEYFDYYSVGLLKQEILKHKLKILKITGFTETYFTEIFEIITSKIRFIDDIIISNSDLTKAIKIVSDIDSNDTLFVALTNHLNAHLWTGDKRLYQGLEMKEYTKIISTEEIYKLYLQKELKNKSKKK
jgi:predicted nucleic acid-binding protein